MDVACSTHGEMRNACRILVGKSEGKKPLGRPRNRWEDNIKIPRRKSVLEGFIWLRIGTGGGFL
jgi:hypothetical protein